MDNNITKRGNEKNVRTEKGDEIRGNGEVGI